MSEGKSKGDIDMNEICKTISGDNITRREAHEHAKALNKLKTIARQTLNPQIHRNAKGDVLAHVLGMRTSSLEPAGVNEHSTVFVMLTEAGRHAIAAPWNSYL